MNINTNGLIESRFLLYGRGSTTYTKRTPVYKNRIILGSYLLDGVCLNWLFIILKLERML